MPQCAIPLNPSFVTETEKKESRDGESYADSRIIRCTSIKGIIECILRRHEGGFSVKRMENISMGSLNRNYILISEEKAAPFV